MRVDEKMTTAIEVLKTAIDARLSEVLPAPATGPERLVEAMRYSLLAPAKRVRPILCLLAAEQVGGEPYRAMAPAVAVELVHAASLVLDDLPAMDDASERRCRPANHRVLGEATAMLAAVTLLNRAYGVIAEADNLPANVQVRAIATLAAAVGADGLNGGQEYDLSGGDRFATMTADDVERTYRLKTAVLFGAAAELGGMAAGGAADATSALGRFGLRLGLAFQAFDDLLDAHASAAALGKDVGQDVGKPTLVSLLGRSATEERARGHVRAALGELETIGGAGTRLGGFATALVTQMTAPLASKTD